MPHRAPLWIPAALLILALTSACDWRAGICYRYCLVLITFFLGGCPGRDCSNDRKDLASGTLP